MKRRELENLLEENGWAFVRQKGPHEIWEHPLFGRMPVSHNVQGRGLKNLIKDIKRGPRRSSMEFPVAPDDISKPMASTTLSEITDVHIADISKSAKTGEPTSGYQFFKRECTKEERDERGLPPQTRYLWWAEAVPEEASEPKKEASEPKKEASEPKKEGTVEQPTPEEPSEKTEYEMLFEEACRENEELKDRLKYLEQANDELVAARENDGMQFLSTQEELQKKIQELQEELAKKPEEVIVGADKAVVARLEKAIAFLEDRQQVAKSESRFQDALAITEFLYSLHKE